MRTNNERMLQMVLSDPELQQRYHYNAVDYPDFYEALNSDNAVVVAVATIIKELNGSDDKTTIKRVYNTVLNYLNDNYIEGL